MRNQREFFRLDVDNNALQGWKEVSVGDETEFLKSIASGDVAPENFVVVRHTDSEQCERVFQAAKYKEWELRIDGQDTQKKAFKDLHDLLRNYQPLDKVEIIWTASHRRYSGQEIADLFAGIEAQKEECAGFINEVKRERENSPAAEKNVRIAPAEAVGEASVAGKTSTGQPTPGLLTPSTSQASRDQRSACDKTQAAAHRLSRYESFVLIITPMLVTLLAGGVIAVQYMHQRQSQSQFAVLQKQFSQADAAQTANEDLGKTLRSGMGELQAMFHEMKQDIVELTKSSQSLARDAESQHKSVADLQSLAEQTLGGLTANQKTQLGELRAELTHWKDISTRVEQQLGLIDGQLLRVADSLQLPREDALQPTLLLVDIGERMQAFNYPAVQQAVLQTVEASLRQTPRRKLGVAASRGDRQLLLLPPEVHFLEPDFAAFRKAFVEHKPAAGERTSRLATLQGALDVLASRSTSYRLLYITCSPQGPAEPTPEAWGKITDQFQKYKLELWVAHLVKPGDAPDAELFALATASGGQYATIRFGDSTSAGIPESPSARRLTAFSLLALDLPAVAGKARGDLP